VVLRMIYVDMIDPLRFGSQLAGRKVDNQPRGGKNAGRSRSQTERVRALAPCEGSQPVHVEGS
jgi:hypothetical protein